MEYIIENKRFSMDYQDLKKTYEEIIKYSDTEFLDNIPRILHFCSFVAYIKNIPTSTIHSDDGVIHELIHILNDVELVNDLKRIRDDFEMIFKLS